MRILIVDDDVFGTKGGGQTVYRKLIQDHPEIDFCYFRKRELESVELPANCTTIELPVEPPAVVGTPVFLSDPHRFALQHAATYAAAARGLAFDVVDAPDYKLFGPYLRDALVTCGVRFGALVHALHGVLSDSIRLDWTGDGQPLLDLRALELQQFDAADLRYGISRSYAKEYGARSAAAVRLVNPSTVLEPRIPVYQPSGSGKPGLLCVGRRERRKGNDLALEMAAWLAPDSFSRLSNIGPPSPAGFKRSSVDMLEQMAAVRGVAWLARDALEPEELFRLYQDDVIVLAPVRYDTFNLVALEAVALGAPLVVSERAGVCDYLESLRPAPPFLKMNPDRPAEAAFRLGAWLADYGAVRAQTHAFALAFQQRIGPLDLRPLYAEALEKGAQERPATTLPALAIGPADVFRRWGSRRPLVQCAVQMAARQPMVRSLNRRARALFAEVRGVPPAPHPDDVASLARMMNRMPERSDAQIEAKITAAGMLGGHAIGRGILWGELSRLERLRGEDLLAAAYDLRVWRMGGAVDPTKLAEVCATLERADLGLVAAVLPAQFGSEASPERLGRLLDERQERLRQPPPPPDLAQVDDRRDRSSRPSISILVSMYRTDGKLARFLALIARQTVRDGIELIFVDADSPYDEQQDLLEAATRLRLDYCYLRTRRRITIQAAWNLALGHARGEYIACLGVDETLYPEALQRLADVLDRRPHIDWAMGSSLVTAVDASGAIIADKMLYDRKDAHRDMVFLDTTYVSWVGGLYRRSIHDRLGYYDAEFRAAGDTEFKMRVAPQLQVAFVPQTLGLFLDYPDDRATAGVLAEVEDALAWYAHRTAAGVARLFANLPSQDLVERLSWCAGRRKCFRSAPSTDVELGALIAEMLARRSDAPFYTLELAGLFSRLRDDLRAYGLGQLASSPAAIEARWKACGVQFEALTGTPSDFRVFNDNVFEQHGWIWPA